MTMPTCPLPLALSLAFAVACRGPSADAAKPENPGATPCPVAGSGDPTRTWAPRFPVEGGGIVVVLAGGAASKPGLERLESSLGLASVETNLCGDELSVWIPGVACPVAPRLTTELAALGPVLGTDCFQPLNRSSLASACTNGALPSDRCHRLLSP